MRKDEKARKEKEKGKRKEEKVYKRYKERKPVFSIPAFCLQTEKSEGESVERR